MNNSNNEKVVNSISQTVLSGPPVKPAVRESEPYLVPQEFDGIKLNQNEAPWDVDPDLKEEILKRMMAMPWNRYPLDPPLALVEKIARYTRFPSDCIMAGNSSNELIQVLISAMCNTGDRILTVSPTFSIYSRAASVMNIDTVAVPLREDFSFDVPALLDQINTVNAVILASPNNPTGTMLEMEEIESILQNTKAAVIMDEAYFEFCGQSAQALIPKYPHLAVLRTFSKALRSAGLRLGYLLAQPDLVRQLEKVKLPFSVGLFQQAAGEVLLDNLSRIPDQVRAVIDERERVFSMLQGFHGISPVPSRANFIFFRCDTCPASQLFTALYRARVLVRSYSSPQLNNMLRVSIGTPEENTVFLDELKKFLSFINSKVGDGADFESPPTNLNSSIDGNTLEKKTITESFSGGPGGGFLQKEPPGQHTRKTRETQISIRLKIEGTGAVSINTPIGFLNHMLESFARHGSFDLEIDAAGDLHVDQHHLVEDCGIVLGQAFDSALADRKGIMRAGFFMFPMDESLVLAAVDLGGRPYFQFEGQFDSRFCGDLEVSLLYDFFQAFAFNSRSNIIIRVLTGRSDHHKAEAMFKALGKSFRTACEKDPRNPGAVPSTKEVI